MRCQQVTCLHCGWTGRENELLSTIVQSQTEDESTEPSACPKCDSDCITYVEQVKEKQT